MTDVPASPGGPEAVVPAALDAVALDKLRELDPDGRRRVVQRVLTAFESSLTRWLAQLEVQRGDSHPATVNHIAHTLKSSASSVGAKDLAQACADVERRLRAGETAELAVDVERLLGLGHSALAAIRAMLRA